MLKEVQEVKVGGRTRRVYVRPFAWNLHAPTHMEWTTDGRLLVVERTTGKVKDVTKGGDMEEAKPFAWGLQGPSSMCPLPDGRVLISEFWGNRIREISAGGEAEKAPVFLDGLIRPYSLAALGKVHVRIFAVASKEPTAFRDVAGAVYEITTGTPEIFIDQIPTHRSPGLEGLAPSWSWKSEDWSAYASGCSKTSWIDDGGVGGGGGGKLLAIAASSLGRVLLYPVGEGKKDLLSVALNYTLALDVGEMGGIKTHPQNGKVYVTKPREGEILALDKETPESYAFHPPVVKGLPTPTCVRFTPDLEGLLVCSPTNGVIWEVRGAIV